MSAALTIQLVGTEAALKRLEGIRGGMKGAMQRALSAGIMRVHRRASLNLSGRVLKVQTGRLRQSLQTSVATDGTSAMVGTNLEYARIHEFGGTTRPHIIRPHNLAGALRIPNKGFIGPVRVTAKGKISKKQGQGPFSFRREVMHPGANIPPRPYMRPALEESTDEIRAIFRKEIGQLLKEAK